MSILEENKGCWLYNQCNHIDCDKDCKRRIKLDYLYNQALITDKQRIYISLRVDKDNSDLAVFKQLKTIETNIIEFVEKGSNLYISSTICGNGKTSWSLRLLQAYFNKIWYYSNLECKALFINIPKFLLAIKDNITDKLDYITHIKENILTADLVIWDDIGNKTITQFESDNLLSMIDGRINQGKSNIFTSNLSNKEMHQFLGDRLTSRIINTSINIYFKGADKRGITKCGEEK